MCPLQLLIIAQSKWVKRQTAAGSITQGGADIQNTGSTGAGAEVGEALPGTFDKVWRHLCLSGLLQGVLRGQGGQRCC